MPRLTVTLCAALGLAVGSASPALAQPAASAAALLDAEGTALMQDHRYPEACPKLAQSDRLQAGTGVMMRLALCYEMWARSASAWSAYREAAGRARRAGDDTLARLAARRAAALEPRLPRVTLRLAGGLDGDAVKVALDGAALDRSALGAPIPLDAGAHSVQVSAPGRALVQRSFSIADGDAPLTVTLGPGPPRADLDAAPGPDEASEAARGGSTRRTWALVAGGVGVAGVAVGAAFGLAAMSTWNRALGECRSGTTGCTPDALGLQSTVSADAAASTVGFSVGAAGLVAAALLWWTAPSGVAAGRAGYRVVPTMDRDGLGVGFVGSL